MSKKAATVEERAHLARMAELGCIVCLEHIGCWSPAEIHHIRSGQGMGQRAKHLDAIPLCPTHHRTGGYGVAIHAGQRTWENKFGTERELLGRTRELLGITGDGQCLGDAS